MSLAGANIFEESTTEGVGQTTVNHSDIDTDPGGSHQDHVHIDHDLSHQACLAEIASLFEDIQADLRIITDRAEDRSKGVYIRTADTVANNPANIAMAARQFINMQDTGTLDLVNAEIANPTDLGNTSDANYSAMRNTVETPSATSVRTNTQSPGFGGNDDAVVGLDSKKYFEHTVPLDQLTLVPGTGEGKMLYSLVGSRTLPLQAELFNLLQSAATAAKVNVQITSGGQVPVNEGGSPEKKNRAGANRFDKGYAAELRLTDGAGTELQTIVPEQLAVMVKFAEECKNAGATSIAMGNGYLDNIGIHVDIAWKGQNAGIIAGVLPLRYWGGPNGKTPPKYLQDLMTPRDNINNGR